MYSNRQSSGWPSQPEARLHVVTMRICLLLATSMLSFVLYASGKHSDAAKPQSPNQTKAGARQHPQININQASVAELKTLPGVGEATAQRIVEYRTKNPPFRRIEELLIIRGISRNRLEQIRNRIRLD